MKNMILSHAAIWTAAALLVVIGALVVLPQSAEAGRNPSLKIKSVKMNITPTADATLDNKKVDISFKWRASRNATGYQIDRRERIGDLSGSISFESEWTRVERQQAGIRYCKKHDHQPYLQFRPSGQDGGMEGSREGRKRQLEPPLQHRRQLGYQVEALHPLRD